MFNVSFVPSKDATPGTVVVRQGDKDVVEWDGRAQKRVDKVHFAEEPSTVDVCIFSDDGSAHAITLQLNQKNDRSEARHAISLSANDSEAPLFEVVLQRCRTPETKTAKDPAPATNNNNGTTSPRAPNKMQKQPPPSMTITLDIREVEGLSTSVKTLSLKLSKGRMVAAKTDPVDVAASKGKFVFERPVHVVLKYPLQSQPDALLNVDTDDVSTSCAIRLKPWFDQLLSGESANVTVSPPTGSIKVHLTALLENPNKARREAPACANLVYDEAFHKACANCGVALGALTPKTYESFKADGVPEEVALHRFQQHQITLIKQLHMVVKERQRLLQAAKKASQRADSLDGRTSPASDCSENDKLIDRAKRQRRVWDVSAQRLKAAKEKRLAETEDIIKRAEEFASSTQKNREVHHQQMVALHRANQEQMQKRWMRDEELARIRQQRINEEIAKREQEWNSRMETVSSARQKRNQALSETAGVSSDENTQARLEKAKELRAKVDEDIAERTRATLTLVEQRREKHVYDQFLKQIELANKALAERETIESTLQRSQQLREQHLQATAARLEEAAARAAAVIAKNKQVIGQTVAEKAQTRETRHAIARENRVRSAQRKEQQRIEREMKREQQMEHREVRLDIEDTKRRDTVHARDEHHHLVVNRVTEQQRATIEAQRARMQKQQETVEERMKKMAEIRSLLIK